MSKPTVKSNLEAIRKLGLKKGTGKPESFPKNGFVSGVVLSAGNSPVRDKTTGMMKQVEFISIKDAESGDIRSYWLDAGLKTVLAQNGVVATAENGIVVKYKEIIAIEHMGMADLGGGKKANNYELYLGAE